MKEFPEPFIEDVGENPAARADMVLDVLDRFSVVQALQVLGMKLYSLGQPTPLDCIRMFNVVLVTDMRFEQS